MLHQVKNFFSRTLLFNRTVWLMLIGNFLVRGCYYMAFPFLIMMLHERYQVGVLEVGSMLAFSAFLGSSLGLYIGYLSDKIGRKVIILFGALLCIVSFFGMGMADEVWQFFISIVLCGIAQPMIYIPSRAVISDQLSDKKNREFALSFNYFVINIGVAVGPLVGGTISLSHPKTVFLTAACVYAIYSLMCLVALKNKHTSLYSQTEINFFKTIQTVRQDKAFVIVMMINFLVMFVFAHLDSSLIQVISLSGAEKSHQIIVNIYLINSLTTVCFQFPLEKWLGHLPLLIRMKIGIALIALAQIGFILAPINSLFAWGVAVFMISMGEAIVFPLMNIQVDRMAPEHLKGVYYGATSLFVFGFACAPIVGGFILKFWGSTTLFLVCFTLCVFAIALYRWSEEKKVQSQSFIDSRIIDSRVVE